jgi:hypothetical protein
MNSLSFDSSTLSLGWLIVIFFTGIAGQLASRWFYSIDRSQNRLAVHVAHGTISFVRCNDTFALGVKSSVETEKSASQHKSVSVCFELDGVVAQLVERLVRNEKVRGSTPLGSTILQNRF